MSGFLDRLSPSLLLTVTALLYTLILMYYYYTGLGGPVLLASIMVPFSVFMIALSSYVKGERLLPERLGGRRLDPLLVFVGGIVALTVSYYIVVEFEELNTVRFGSYNDLDVAIGGLAFAMVMLATLKRYPSIFALNVILLFYALDGRLFPYPFSHPGIRPERIVTAMSVEFETGVFEKLAQLALTLIGPFLLFIAIAQAFGAVESLVRIVIGASRGRPRMVPQAAVAGSMVIAMVSGSGAANAASTGSITIPLMKRVGMPPVKAAAVETAASIGGQLMPPIMGISAFVMADYLGVSYFDVVARGWVPALIYYLGVALAVYLVARRFVSPSSVVETPRPSISDYFKALSLLSAVALLIVLMGVRREYPAYAALQASALLALLLIAWELRASGVRGVAGRLVEVIRSFASNTAEITILLSSLGVMTGLMTITGVPTRIGFLMLEATGGSLILIAVIGFIFGYLVGLGLPPVVTYILTVSVAGLYMIEAGLNPWVVHFYAFFIGVMSELSPPTSVTAAVTSRIANAGFTETMLEALRVATPLFILIAGVIVVPGLVAEPGMTQLLAGARVALAALVVTVALNADLRLHVLRIILAALGITVLVI